MRVLTMDPSRLFSHTSELIYFNHASSSPLPVQTRERMKEVLDQLAYGDLPWEFWCGQLELFRSRSARLIGSRPEEICFIPNTSTGLLIALYAIPWEKGDNVVHLRDNFPANSVPWVRNLRTVERREVAVEGDAPLEDRLMARVDGDTKAVVVDWVDFLTGYRLDLKAVGEACRERGIFLVVDGIQGLGSMPIDVSKLSVDFLAASSAKWLLGPVGAGILYIDPSTMDRLNPAMQGWMCHDWKAFNVFDPLPPERKGAGVFEAGSYPGLPLVGLVENLSIFDSLGISKVSGLVWERCRALDDGLSGMGAEMVSPTDEKHASGIVTFRPPGRRSADKLFEHLTSKKIVVSLRKGAIRLSPHFYNSADEVDSVISEITGF